MNPYFSEFPQQPLNISKWKCPSSGPSCGTPSWAWSFKSTTDFTNCATGSYDIESGQNFNVGSTAHYTFTVKANNPQDDPNAIGFSIYKDNTWPASDDFIYQRGSYGSNGSEVGGIYLEKGKDYYIAIPTNATNVFAVCLTPS